MQVNVRIFENGKNKELQRQKHVESVSADHRSRFQRITAVRTHVGRLASLQELLRQENVECRCQHFDIERNFMSVIELYNVVFYRNVYLGSAEEVENVLNTYA